MDEASCWSIFCVCFYTSIKSISFISFPLMFFFTTMEMAKISEYNLLDCVIRFGGVKKSTIFCSSLWFAGAEAHCAGRVLAIEGK